jgi:hypothetical protein
MIAMVSLLSSIAMKSMIAPIAMKAMPSLGVPASKEVVPARSG